MGFGSAAPELAWWANVDGSGLVWDKHSIDGTGERFEIALAADIDGDGDLDAVAVQARFSDTDLVWWENENGAGTSWRRIDVATGERRRGPRRAADLDGDGDTDLVTGEVWLENLAGGEELGRAPDRQRPQREGRRGHGHRW